MITQVAQVTVPVTDYDEALSWYTEKLGLEVRVDSKLGPGYRWVAVGARGQRDVELVLHLSGLVSERQIDGGPPKLVFCTDDCRRDHQQLSERGVCFRDGPHDFAWGVQALFEDPFGNSYVLVQRTACGPSN
jgi:catechol 2,3-dioxygenase-like lactoylglutathione lyase family enzyme